MESGAKQERQGAETRRAGRHLREMAPVKRLFQLAELLPGDMAIHVGVHARKRYVGTPNVADNEFLARHAAIRIFVKFFKCSFA